MESLSVVSGKVLYHGCLAVNGSACCPSSVRYFFFFLFLILVPRVRGKITNISTPASVPLKPRSCSVFDVISLFLRVLTYDAFAYLCLSTKTMSLSLLPVL